MDRRASLTVPRGLAALLHGLVACLAGAATAASPESRTPAEIAAGVAIADARFPELDIRRYGARCDYDAAAETDGKPARKATDNLPAFKAAIAVAAKRGGGTVRVDTGGDCYVSNTINGRGIDNLWFHVAAGTTVRATRYTSMGALFALGNTPANPSVRNVGLSGGGTVRTFRPKHEALQPHRPKTRYEVGAYVLSTDANGEKRAYYAKRAGVSGPDSPPDMLNGADTDGTVVWQDADNDNAIALAGEGATVLGMSVPEASGKAITVQTPRWSKVVILGNRIGSTNDKAIEVKGQQGLPAQREAFGDGAWIIDNVVESAGREGIEIEQSANGRQPNRDCHVIGNLVRSAGAVNGASGIRINRCEAVEVRGNRVLRAAGNGYHLRLVSDVSGDLTAGAAGLAGVNLQRVSAFSFDRIEVLGPARYGVLETGCRRGGSIGELVVKNAQTGYRATGRAGPAPRVKAYDFEGLSGSGFSGARPQVPSAPE